MGRILSLIVTSSALCILGFIIWPMMRKVNGGDGRGTMWAARIVGVLGLLVSAARLVQEFSK